MPLPARDAIHEGAKRLFMLPGVSTMMWYNPRDAIHSRSRMESILAALRLPVKCCCVRWEGLEPSRLAAHGPQPCLSANSSTSAV